MSQPSPLERVRTGLEYAQDMMEDEDCRCTFCHALRDALAALREMEQQERPTPDVLRLWAEWFDNPKNPSCVLPPDQGFRTAGYVLRRIAERLEESLERGENT